MNSIKIKTVQPYKLYIKILEAKKSAKKRIIGVTGAYVVMGFIWGCFDSANFLYFLILPVVVLIAAPIMLYNPHLNQLYKPGQSYSWVKEYASLKAPNFLTSGLVIFGILSGIIGDILAETFPLLLVVAGGGMFLFACYAKKHPEKVLIDKYGRMRLRNHQNIDYNVKIDLSTIFGINDKMCLSYQNFHYYQEKMEKGDYLLGVSPLGVYFANKTESVNKTFIKFEDIDTLGLLATIGNIFVFNIKSKSNIEINIIIDENASLLISPYMFFDTLLDTLDSYCINGGAVSAQISRRRRITTSSEISSSVVIPEANAVESGRSIDIDNSVVSGTQDETHNRMVEISFSEGVLDELASGTMLTSNRNIEI